MALMLKGQGQTLLARSQSVQPVTRTHTFTSPSTASPPTAQLCQELGRAATTREAPQEHGFGHRLGQAAQPAG